VFFEKKTNVFSWLSLHLILLDKKNHEKVLAKMNATTKRKQNYMYLLLVCFVGLALVGKDIVFRFIIECNSSLRDFGPY
jgi:hypothetical protein